MPDGQQYEISHAIKECLKEENRLRETNIQQIGRYNICNLISVGGMGELYLADDNDNQKVAIKILKQDIVGEEFNKRFQQEADVLSCLDHVHICKMLEFSFSMGKWFIATDFVDGKNLQQLVQMSLFNDYDAAIVAVQLAKALQYALGKQVIHRDIKPGNLMIERGTFHLKVIDFGLGKILTCSDGFTDPRSILGSPRYMAPEQIVDPSSVDHKADIYALGATMYFLMTRNHPYYQHKKLVDILKAKSGGPPIEAHVINPNIHPEISRIIEKLMQIKVNKRYQTYGEIIQDLETFLDSQENRQQTKIISVKKYKKYRIKTLLYCAKKLGFLTSEEAHLIYKMKLDLKQYFKSKPNVKSYAFNGTQMLYITYCILEMIKRRQWLGKERHKKIMAKQIELITSDNSNLRLLIVDHFKNKETLKRLNDIFFQKSIFSKEDQSMLLSFMENREQNADFWGNTVVQSSEKQAEIPEEETVTIAPNELKVEIDENLLEIIKTPQ